MFHLHCDQKLKLMRQGAQCLATGQDSMLGPSAATKSAKPSLVLPPSDTLADIVAPAAEDLAPGSLHMH